VGNGSHLPVDGAPKGREWLPTYYFKVTSSSGLRGDRKGEDPEDVALRYHCCGMSVTTRPRVLTFARIDVPVFWGRQKHGERSAAFQKRPDLALPAGDIGFHAGRVVFTDGPSPLIGGVQARRVLAGKAARI